MADGIKYLTKELLVELNSAARLGHAIYTMPPSLVAGLPDQCRFPVIQYEQRGEDCVCIDVGLNAEGDSEFLDISKKQFDDLPIFVFGESDVTRH